MRIAFLILVLLHGLIHLLGFVKGFGLKEVKQLTLPISKATGIFWLLAFGLFALFALAQLLQSKHAWWLGFIAVLISQILIFMCWRDARFGTIPNIIVLIVAFVSFGAFLLKSEFEGNVKEDFLSNNAASVSILEESDMQNLPEIVKKYLYYTKSVGQPKVRNFRSEFTGGIRGKEGDEFMQFQSVQYNFFTRPSRYFYMQAKQKGLPATGLHQYEKETASFRIKVLNWFTVVNAQGDKLNQAETVTLLNDMILIAPPSIIDKRITWENVNDTTVKCYFNNNGLKVSAVVYFNSDGKLLNFISNDRYETDGVAYNNYPWETPVEEYIMMNGYYLPGKAKLIYRKPEGPFTYGEFVYKSVKFNVTEYTD